MAITTATFAPRFPLNSGTADALGDDSCLALQCILDMHFSNLVAMTNTLSNADLAATTHRMLREFKAQQDKLFAHVNENLSLIDEMWLFLQAHFEQQLAVTGRAADQGEPSASGQPSAEQ